MFTGIVEGIGHVSGVEQSDGVISLTLDSDVVQGMKVGGSVSVNGACLTAVSVDGHSIKVEVVGETQARTGLGELSVGSKVNLERPMTPATLFDGHIVQGHVDGQGEIASVIPDGDSVRMMLEVPRSLMRYIVEKGSIAIDGVSLTVSAVTGTGFEVALIPHTLDATTLGQRQVGDTVNLEVDVLAKYVERLLKN